MAADRDTGLFDDLTIDEDLVQSPEHKAAATGTIDFDGLLQPGLLIHQDLANGNGGQAWPAGMVLTKYLLRRKRDELRQCSSILELGAGGGLVGLAVAAGCDPKGVVHITDQQPMLDLMRHNIALNKLQDKAVASVYNWGEGSDDVPPQPDILLAADCVYFEPAFPLLQQSLQALIGPKTVCYFCFKKRRRADLRFMMTVNKLFSVQSVTDDPDREAYSRENIFLSVVVRKVLRTKADQRTATGSPGKKIVEYQ